MILFGKNACKEALKSENVTIIKMLLAENMHGSEYAEIINLAKSRNVKFVFVPKALITDMVKNPNNQGVLVETSEYVYSNLDDILNLAQTKNQDPFILVLDGISDPHNLGAILRVAECAGVHGVIISKNRCCSVNDTVIKTSSGAANLMLVARETNITATLKTLKAKNIFVYGVELGGSDVYKTNLTGPIALVIGSEGAGISLLVKETCDEIITFPQQGKINSLNASVAAGVAIYETLRQRLKKLN